MTPWKFDSDLDLAVFCPALCKSGIELHDVYQSMFKSHGRNGFYTTSLGYALRTVAEYWSSVCKVSFKLQRASRPSLGYDDALWIYQQPT